MSGNVLARGEMEIPCACTEMCLFSCHHTCVLVWHRRGDPVSQRAFLPFFHRHSGRQGYWVGLEGHALASNSPRFARSDPRQARTGAALSAHTQRGSQERKPSPNPPENCTRAPDLIDATRRARSRRASSHWVDARRADRRRETVHCGASHQRVYYRSLQVQDLKKQTSTALPSDAVPKPKPFF